MSMAEIHEHKSGEYTNGVLHASDVKESGEHNIVFGSLVTGDNDIVGLVAYSIYKQNKHDWLIAFNKATGRPPNEAENAAYIIGESTPRRLSIYRHLAEATLEGRGPATAASGEGLTQRSYAIAAKAQTAARPSGLNWSFIGFIGLAVIGAIALALALRFGLSKP